MASGFCIDVEDIFLKDSLFLGHRRECSDLATGSVLSKITTGGTWGTVWGVMDGT